jgi:hypothetical protein
LLPLQLLTVDPLARHRRHRQMASVLRHWEALLLAQVLAQAAEVVALPVAAEARPVEAEALPQVVRALPVAAQPGPGPELGPAPEPESVQPAPAPGWPQPQILEPRMVSVGVPFLKPHLCCLDALVVPVWPGVLEPPANHPQQELSLPPEAPGALLRRWHASAPSETCLLCRRLQARLRVAAYCRGQPAVQPQARAGVRRRGPAAGQPQALAVPQC